MITEIKWPFDHQRTLLFPFNYEILSSPDHVQCAYVSFTDESIRSFRKQVLALHTALHIFAILSDFCKFTYLTPQGLLCCCLLVNAFMNIIVFKPEGIASTHVMAAPAHRQHELDNYTACCRHAVVLTVHTKFCIVQCTHIGTE